MNAMVLTTCSVTASGVSCSQPVSVAPALSSVELRLADGMLARFVVATLNF